MENLKDQMIRARSAGAPIIAIQSADQLALIQKVVEVFGVGPESDPGDRPVLVWDIAQYFAVANQTAKGKQLGTQALSKIMGQMSPDVFNNPFDALKAAAQMPAKGTLIIPLCDRYLKEAAIVQAILNLRDAYKGNMRRLVMLGTNFMLPSELQNSVIVLDEPFPDEAQVEAQITEFYTDQDVKCDDKVKKTAVSALKGLAPFAIEQSAALAVDRKDGALLVDVPSLWARKRQAISQTRGLQAPEAEEGYEGIAGIEQIKNYFRKLFSGPMAAKCIVFMDEIEKSMGGAGTSGLGDSSGTSQDALGVVLNRMESSKAMGVLLLGPPGVCKSWLALCTAAEFGVPLIILDLGATKGSLVGQSEEQIRNAMKSIDALAGKGGALYIGTCNRLETLPPELRRRFRNGLWFLDLPDEEERIAIGKVHCAKNKLPYDPEFWRSKDGWSGANIRDCCEQAVALQCSLEEAQEFIVSAKDQDAAALTSLRNLATGRFLSASYKGVYRGEGNAPAKSGEEEVKVATAPRRVLERGN